jgi:hypothetical protein
MFFSYSAFMVMLKSRAIVRPFTSGELAFLLGITRERHGSAGS